MRDSGLPDGEEPGADGDPGQPDGDRVDGGDELATPTQIWVDQAACPGNGAGNEADPYCSVGDAVRDVATGGQVTIRAEAMLAATLVLSRDLTLQGEAEGEGESVLRASNCPVVSALGGAQVTIRHLQLRSDQGDADNGALQVSGGAQARVEDCRIGSSACIGVRCVQADCSLARNWIRDNSAGGVLLDRTRFDLINNIIAENGESGTQGGVSIQQPQSGSAFVHNTVARNASLGSTPAGVTCSGGNLDIESSILWENDNDQVNSICRVVYSALSQDSDSVNGGPDNLYQQDPLFLSDGQNDYHLSGNSPCIDRGSSSPSVAVSDDIDGQSRDDGLPDMGADEVD